MPEAIKELLPKVEAAPVIAAPVIEAAPVAEPVVVPAEPLVNPELKVEVAKPQPELPADTNLDRFLTAKGVEVKPKDDAKPIVVPAEVQQKAAPIARDYTGIDETLVPILKKMGNEFFDVVKPLALEVKQSKAVIAERDAKIAELAKAPGRLPDSYFEHPQGFILSPEYARAAQDEQTATTIYNHWQEQLINIREGKDWQDLDIDPKTGQLVLGAMLPANRDSEISIGRNLTHAQHQYTKQMGKRENIEQSFGTQHKNDVQVLADASKSYMGVLEDKNHFLWPVINQVFEAIPASFKRSPLALMLAKSVAINIELNKIITEASAKEKKAETIAIDIRDDKRKAGPNGVEINSGAGGVVGTEISMDAFNRVKTFGV